MNRLKLMRPRTIAILVGIAIVVAGLYVGYRAYEARYWVSHWRGAAAEGVVLSVEPSRVKAGGRLALVGSFSKAYDFGYATGNDRIHIYDQGGTNRFLTPDERRAIDSNPTSGFAFPGDEGIGCPLVEPQTHAPRKHTERVDIVILPETPTGEYLLRLDPGFFCNDLPREATNLLFWVEGQSTNS